MRLLILIFTITVCRVQGQPVADFAVPASACVEERIKLINNSINGSAFQWDFCQGDLSLTPVASVPFQVPGNIDLGIDVVFDGEQWFGFVTDASNNTINRLTFGVSLSNIPQIVSLGSIFQTSVFPYDIKLVNDNGAWYGFVYGVDQLITRLDFGTSLTNTPATHLVVGGAGTTSGLDVVRDDAFWYIVYTQNFSVNVLRLQTITSIPAAQDFVSTMLPDASARLGDIRVLKNESSDEWYAFTVSYDASHTCHRLAFGQSLLSVANVNTFNVDGLGSSTPYGIDVTRDDGIYQCFISTITGNLVRINLGSDLDVFQNTATVLGTFQTLDKTLKLRVVRDRSSWYIFSPSYTTGEIFRLSFPEVSCTVQTVSNAPNPSISYPNAGTYTVTLSTFGNGQSAEVTKKITVDERVAPAILVSKQSICIQTATNFGINGFGVTSASWNFGDGNISNEISPTHQYANAGEYAVAVDVFAENGCRNSAEEIVTIYEVPIASFSLPTASPVCTNNNLSFQTLTPDIYSGALSYQWFIDSQPVATTRDLTFAFLSTSDKAVKLRLLIPGCSSESENMITNILAGPLVNFEYEGICDEEPTSFSNKSSGDILSYAWNFGAQSSTDVNPVVTFPNTGNYNVSLSAEASNGCINTTTKQLTIRPKPVPDFGVASPALLCSVNEIQFEDRSSDPEGRSLQAWNWNFGDDSAINSMQSPKHSYAVQGTYNIRLETISEFGCRAAVQKNINILPSPASAFTNAVACSEQPVRFTGPSGSNIRSYSWQIADRTYATQSPLHTFRASGDYEVVLRVTGNNNCVATTRKNITVPVPLVPDFTVDKNCVDIAATLTDVTPSTETISTWQWTIEGQNLSGKEVSYTFSNEGTNNVQLTVGGESGCSYSIVKPVSVTPSPVANFTISSDVGAPSVPFLFTNRSQGATTSQWNFGDGTISSEQSPTYQYNALGEYSVTLAVVNSEGCEDSETRLIQITPPAPDASVVAVTERVQSNNGKNFIVTIQNDGNTLLENLPVLIDIAGVSQLIETVKGPIYPQARLNLTLSYSVIQNTKISYVCAETNLDDDINTTSDRYCIDFTNGFRALPAYPNPATDKINVGWTNAAEGDTQLVLISETGRQLLEVLVPSNEGFNTVTLDINNVPAGLYLLKIKTPGELAVQRIAIVR